MMIVPIKTLRPTRCQRTKNPAAVGLFGLKIWDSLKQKQTCLLNSWVFNCYIICLPPCTFGSFGHISRILINITNGQHVHYLRRFGATKASRKFRWSAHTRIRAQIQKKIMANKTWRSIFSKHRACQCPIVLEILETNKSQNNQKTCSNWRSRFDSLIIHYSDSFTLNHPLRVNDFYCLVLVGTNHQQYCNVCNFCIWNMDKYATTTKSCKHIYRMIQHITSVIPLSRAMYSCWCLLPGSRLVGI